MFNPRCACGLQCLALGARQPCRKKKFLTDVSVCKKTGTAMVVAAVPLVPALMRTSSVHLSATAIVAPVTTKWQKNSFHVYVVNAHGQSTAKMNQLRSTMLYSMRMITFNFIFIFPQDQCSLDSE